MNGKDHQKAANIAIAAGLCATPWVTTQGVAISLQLFFLGGLILGKFADPDLRDQEQIRNESEREVERYFGWAFARAWSGYWQLPAKAIRHRSRLSHLPIFGTFIAAAWLVVPQLLAIYLLLQPAIPFLPWAGEIVASANFLAFFVGWVVQDVIHRLLDVKFLYPIWRVLL